MMRSVWLEARCIGSDEWVSPASTGGKSSNRLDEIRLPTACPELTPCEGVWDWSKLNDMGNVTPQSFEDLISRTRSSLTKFQHRDHIHRWCYHQSEIELIES
jgi:hypothetical protein